MRAEIALLLLAVSVAVVSARRGRSGYDCSSYCRKWSIKYVCSTEGNTYNNECMLKCDWANKGCDGKCPCYRAPPPRVYYKPRPVENYEPVPVYNEPVPVYNEPVPVYNEPIPVYNEAPSQSDCYCGSDKDYVCTYDGETYDNECEAKCDGKYKMCDGQCPCS